MSSEKNIDFLEAQLDRERERSGVPTEIDLLKEKVSYLEDCIQSISRLAGLQHEDEPIYVYRGTVTFCGESEDDPIEKSIIVRYRHPGDREETDICFKSFVDYCRWSNLKAGDVIGFSYYITYWEDPILTYCKKIPADE